MTTPDMDHDPVDPDQARVLHDEPFGEGGTPDERADGAPDPAADPAPEGASEDDVAQDDLAAEETSQEDQDGADANDPNEASDDETEAEDAAFEDGDPDRPDETDGDETMAAGEAETPVAHPAAAFDQADLTRMVEAILFASADPVPEKELASRLPKGTDLKAMLADIQTLYEGRGVTLVEVAGQWMFRTAPDMGFLLTKERVEPRKLSRAAIETLAIIAYHQPVTRAEIEELRGVTVSKGTLDVLLDVGWVGMRGRRQVPGRPITYGTTTAFLEHFGLAAVTDLPGMEELKAAGLLDWRLPPDFSVPAPKPDGQGEGDGDFSEDEEDTGLEPSAEELAEAAAMSEDELFQSSDEEDDPDAEGEAEAESGRETGDDPPR